MSAKQHFVHLKDEERLQVERAVRSNKNSPRERLRARILLAASDPAGFTDKQLAAQVGASALTVWRVRKRFAEGGLPRALHHAEQTRRKARRLDGRAEAHLVALVCSAPPDERKRWSLHLLADTDLAPIKRTSGCATEEHNRYGNNAKQVWQKI